MSNNEKPGRLDLVEDRIVDLEERVSFLESEVGDDVERRKFERKMDSLLGDSYTFSEMGSTLTAKVSATEVDLQRVIKRVEEHDEWSWNVWQEDGEYIVSVQNRVPMI